jgi:hypothetical protein
VGAAGVSHDAHPVRIDIGSGLHFPGEVSDIHDLSFAVFHAALGTGIPPVNHGDARDSMSGQLNGHVLIDRFVAASGMMNLHARKRSAAFGWKSSENPQPQTIAFEKKDFFVNPLFFHWKPYISSGGRSGKEKAKPRTEPYEWRQNLVT